MEYERFATGVAAAFESYAANLVAAYLRSRLAGASLTPPSVSLQAELHRLDDRYMNQVGQLTGDYLHQSGGHAPAATRLINNLGRIAREATLQITRRVRGLDVRSLFTSEPEGAMHDLLRRAADKVEFTTQDSAGRTWKSQALVRFLARDFAYQLTVDAQARDLAQDGDLAQIQYTDQSHVNNGMVVSLSGAPDYPSFQSVRQTIFHPNASAQLIHVRPE